MGLLWGENWMMVHFADSRDLTVSLLPLWNHTGSACGFGYGCYCARGFERDSRCDVSDQDERCESLRKLVAQKIEELCLKRESDQALAPGTWSITMPIRVNLRRKCAALYSMWSSRRRRGHRVCSRGMRDGPYNHQRQWVSRKEPKRNTGRATRRHRQLSSKLQLFSNILMAHSYMHVQRNPLAFILNSASASYAPSSTL
jgi:hypothetical protein